MNNQQELTLSKSNIIVSMKFIALLGVSVLAPFFGQQMITGTIVNAVLFITTIVLGIKAGFLVAIIPSLIAFSIGTLPMPLTPMIPYIIISNVLLILIFSGLKNKNYWLAIGTASFLKFIFLFSTSSIVLDLVIKKEIAQNILIMMSYPQLLTALAGGFLAKLFLDQKRIKD
jgi:riboflavin transporter